MFFYDSTYILVVIGAILCLLASAGVNRTFQKYAKVQNHAGLTGAMAAEQILRANGIYDVQIEHIAGNLTDHYDPSARVLRLSDSTYQSASVAAVGVAAHECGHAVQHQMGYMPLRLRAALVPAANIGSKLAWPLIILGLVIRSNSSDLLISVGLALFCMAVLFQVVTLPVELNASRRAVCTLQDNGMLDARELEQTKTVLRAAALTYVAAMASSVLQLLRILLLASRRRND